MSIADVSLPKGRVWIVAFLVACLPTAAAAAVDRPETVPAACAATEGSRSLLLRDRCANGDRFAAWLDAAHAFPATLRFTTAASEDRTASLPRLELAALPRSFPVPPVTAAPEPEAELAPPMIVGAASMYDPTDPDDRDAGGMETANGETYDPEGWTAAIQIDLRRRFGGVRYRMSYEPAYALVELGDKRAVVRINDVGPLRPGRIIDFNRRTMRYFDPSLRLGVLQGVRVTVLDGRHWALGPVDDADSPIAVAQASLAVR